MEDGDTGVVFIEVGDKETCGWPFSRVEEGRYGVVVIEVRNRGTLGVICKGWKTGELSGSSSSR